MIPKEIHRRINEVEPKLHKEWMRKVSEKVDKALKSKGEYNVLTLRYVPNDTITTILVGSNGAMMVTLDVYNQHIWGYIVNHLYFSKHKSVTFGSSLTFDENTLKFDEDFYKELDEVFNDEEYVELKKIVYNTKES